ncbi:spherulin 4-like cell surface protein [Aaosphaeria arxii CBS 175.79]|uniref:Spherulin 4-like cell surface protein n=1 Tax=Aaosphaeria arxii CBS 175.79 TaxID=1450172 RepID=A0A6A5XXQ0_9PLEO|nr:spherulin 4-like cell surface protein [Aaosphaeria arxii CBS 175.79]KAF2017683.1 spherulin 4-like cell surface protein [Aaosphaeria arxii CBS 175.79]
MAGDSDIPKHFQDWNTSEAPKMMPSRRTTNSKPFYKRPLGIAIIAGVTIAILIAIIVPLAVILPKRGRKHDATVILPLYIYPDETSTWNPLYDSLKANPQLQFLVIVNPASGPGSSQYPDEKYQVEIEKLNGYPNVETVGYVRTGYASRNLTDVLTEVSTYAGWLSKSNLTAMHGIFFDESPHQYSAEAVDFMLQATKAVKESGLLGKKTVIRNPGVIPDSRFNDTNTDISVVFEQSLEEYKTKEQALAELPSHRSQYSYMVHSVPLEDKSTMRKFVDELSKKAQYLFVTSNAEQYYESFGSDWAQFTEVVPR